MKLFTLNGSVRILLPLTLSMVCIVGLLTLCMSCNEGDDEASQAQTVNGLNITILHTNDMHSHMLGFSPNSDYTPESTGDDLTMGGMARIAAIIDQVRQEKEALGEPVLLLDAGDFLMGTAFSFLAETASVELTLMAELGYDAAALGNHEFDWTPESLAYIISSAMNTKGDLFPILCSNMVFDPEDPRDDLLEDLFEDGTIRSTFVKELSNGLTVGFFGLVGEDAASVAPFASPIDFGDPIEAATEAVAELEAEGVDIVICQSHSGVSGDPATSEDELLAAAVPGIDVIISGHTHTLLVEPRMAGATPVVQAGAYGLHIGKLELTVDAGNVTVRNYELIDIDDSIAGDMTIQAQIENHIDEVETSHLAQYGLAFDEPVAETAYDLVMANTETNLGNLIADSIRNQIDRFEYNPKDPGSQKVDFAFESNGVIRDEVHAGTTGQIWTADAIRAVPLGFGPDGEPGYPLISFYITGKELKRGLEVITTVYPMKGGDYFLQTSGLRFEYSPQKFLFNRVTAVYQVHDDGTETPIDTSDENHTLYKVGINLYVGQFMAIVGEFTYGFLTIVPKNADCTPVVDFDDTIVRDDQGRELKEWRAFIDYIGSFEDLDGDDLPDIPERYAGPEGRMVEVPSTCFIGSLF